jgi:hypothetical protein
VTADQINRMLQIPARTYNVFFTTMDQLHGVIHCSIGGTMCARLTDNTGQTAFAAVSCLHHHR